MQIDKQIPKKITPDNIRDSIVEFKFSTKLPPDVIIGMAFNSIDDTYIYDHIQNIFFNDYIKALLLPNSLIFNCKESYISWERYRLEIEKLLIQFLNSNIKPTFQSVGLRYISEHSGKLLVDIAKFNYSIDVPLNNQNSYNFNSTFKLDNLTVHLNLSQNRKNLNNENEIESSSITSTIDIDVIDSNIGTNTCEELLKVCDAIHKKETELFFLSILNSEYLKTLNPEY